METPSTLIVGYGITGKNLHREIAALNPDICDIDSAKIPPEHQGRNYSKYDAIFVCVDTPYVSREKRCDITAVEKVIDTHKEELAAGGVFVIKSTIPPHTTSQLNNCFPLTPIFHRVGWTAQMVQQDTSNVADVPRCTAPIFRG